jgi:hypothetical protein
MNFFKSIYCLSDVYSYGCSCGALEHAYTTLDSIKDKLIVRCENHEYPRFYVFVSINAFLVFLKRQPTNKRSFHEIIFGKNPQKIKIDLDGMEPDNAWYIAQLVANKCMKVLFRIYYKYITEYAISRGVGISDILDTCITISEGIVKNKRKIGYHVIIKNFSVVSNREVAFFTRRLIDILPREYAPYIDMGVNKSTQNFRLIGCHKINEENRFKKLVNQKKDQPSDTIISIIDSQMILPAMTPDCEIQNTPNYDKHEKQIIINCYAELDELEKDAYEFRDIQYSNEVAWVSFNRTRESYCHLCKRNHSTDNSLFFILLRGALYRRCRRSI